MIDHLVKQGDCLLSIAERHGVPWKSIWEHEENSELKSLRKDPNVLFPGDVVKIPLKDVRTESGATNKRHRFAKAPSPAMVRIRILEDDKPKANQPFKLIVGENEIGGRTNGEGLVESDIPPDASDAILVVGSGTEELRIPLKIGYLDPIDTDSGVRQRLFMLGFRSQDSLEGPLRAFQEKHGLKMTGNVDDPTRQKLKREFGQ
jgi:LysM domain-containing protein